ncbi:HTH-type transcriptional regulator MtrR [Mycobacterium talmoniae]|uniref:HTH-type transcriptional regulator MtrR n=1 Tax=Mycobacterium talmoniae TaxID=1858794 RepID=A0A2S8BNV6_9MYCO|nr:HTH-type transcriptional regulator MtrR [Mycobacterium talmoniae]
MVNPRATNEDLTAKARIRNAALDLYAQYGEDRVSLRDIASAAGVTLGLVQHHFKTKAGLRDAVDQLVVDYFAHALAEVPAEPAPGASRRHATRPWRPCSATTHP